MKIDTDTAAGAAVATAAAASAASAACIYDVVIGGRFARHVDSPLTCT